MTLKLKPNFPNGINLSLHVRRRHGHVGATLRPCWWFFFYHEDVVHREYAPPGQTVTKEYYIKVLLQLRDAVRGKRLQLWASGDWQLCHNNVPAHSSSLMPSFLAKHHITQVCQPLCSPDLALCDLWLFPKLKSRLKGRRFVNVTVTQYTSSLCLTADWLVPREGVLGCAVMSPLTGCQVTSRPCNWFSRYSVAGYFLDRPHTIEILSH